MPQKPKIFKKGDQLYDVPDNEVQDFLKEVPDAVEINVYEKDGQTFDVPLNELDAFMQEVPGATLVEGSKKKFLRPTQILQRAGQGVPQWVCHHYHQRSVRLSLTASQRKTLSLRELRRKVRGLPLP
jgi:hypothetical protein